MWIYLACLMDSTSSLDMVESLWDSKNGCAPSHIVKLSDTHKEFFCLECSMAHCQQHPSGTMSSPSMVDPSKVMSISSSGGFHAKILAVQEMERAWEESEAACFSRLSGLPKNAAQSLSFWKMSQPSVLEAGKLWGKSWPESGMIVDGRLYPLRKSVPLIYERDGSYWPTPKARDWHDNGTSPSEMKRNSPSLPAMPLRGLLATPTASQASKPIRAPSPSRMNGTHGEDIQDSVGRISPPLIGKKLNVLFLEWMMGLPFNHTELKPSVMVWFQIKSKKRLKG